MGKNEKVRSIEKLADSDRSCIGVCAGKHCAKAGTKHILRALQSSLAEACLTDKVAVELTKCQDYCDDAPSLTVLPGPYPYIDLTPATAQQIVTEHIVKGKVIVSMLDKRTRKRLKKAERVH